MKKYKLKIKLPKTKEFVGNIFLYTETVSNIILPVTKISQYKDFPEIYDALKFLNNFLGLQFIDLFKIGKAHLWPFPIYELKNNTKELYNVLSNNNKKSFLMLNNFKDWITIKAIFKIHKVYYQNNIWFISSKD